MPEYIQVIQRYLLDNPKFSKPALVELLSKRFPNLPAGEVWIIVARYFNKTAEKPAIVPRKRPSP
jgi:hypothetical protein